MKLWEILLIALSLSTDAFAASVCKGLSSENSGVSKCLKAGLYFGIFQAVMPLIGGFVAGIAAARVASYSHYISSAVLFLIGIGMIREGISDDNGSSSSDMSPKEMIPLSFATSVDAFAVGIILTLENGSIVTESLIIGLVTFILSALGIKIGGLFGHKHRKIAGACGGAVLIILAIKFLIFK